MNMPYLAHRRAKCLALLELVDGWDISEDRTERRLHKDVVAAYRKAEAQFNSATATLTNSELKEMGGSP